METKLRRIHIARKTASLVIVAICVTGLGVAAVIVGGPIFGVTHLHQTGIQLAWQEPNLADTRWTGEVPYEESLYTAAGGFLADIWGGASYALDWTASYPDSGDADQPYIEADVILRIHGTGSGLTVDDVSVQEWVAGVPANDWFPVIFTVESGDLVGPVLYNNVFSPGEVLNHQSLYIVVSPLTAEQDLTFSLTAIA